MCKTGWKSCGQARTREQFPSEQFGDSYHWLMTTSCKSEIHTRVYMDKSSEEVQCNVDCDIAEKSAWKYWQSKTKTHLSPRDRNGWMWGGVEYVVRKILYMGINIENHVEKVRYRPGFPSPGWLLNLHLNSVFLSRFFLSFYTQPFCYCESIFRLLVHWYQNHSWGVRSTET